jgi:mRNA-degrading endonuclease RelE of RelBE toxin-antitoxin system
MIKVEVTKKFRRELQKFIANNQIRVQLVSSTLKTYLNNPKHPALYTEKLKGSKMWTMRISKSSRIFFTWIDQSTALLIDIGPHDKYRQY